MRGPWTLLALLLLVVAATWIDAKAVISPRLPLRIQENLLKASAFGARQNLKRSFSAGPQQTAEPLEALGQYSYMHDLFYEPAWFR